MMYVPYFCRADLVHALGAQLVTSTYDDEAGGAGPADLPSIDACIRYGTSQCKTFLLSHNLESSLPQVAADVTDALRFAALDFGITYTMRRKPDVVLALGAKSWTEFLDAAVAQMDRYAKTLQILPSPMVAPANVGVRIAEGDAARVQDDTQRVWDAMGLF